MISNRFMYQTVSYIFTGRKIVHKKDLTLVKRVDKKNTSRKKKVHKTSTKTRILCLSYIFFGKLMSIILMQQPKYLIFITKTANSKFDVTAKINYEKNTLRNKTKHSKIPSMHQRKHGLPFPCFIPNSEQFS